jgi:hypothetical protein
MSPGAREPLQVRPFDKSSSALPSSALAADRALRSIFMHLPPAPVFSRQIQKAAIGCAAKPRRFRRGFRFWTRGPTLPGKGDKLVGDQLCLALQAAAPGKVCPLARPQVVVITPSGFRVSAGRWAYAEQSTSPKIDSAGSSKNAMGSTFSRFRHSQQLCAGSRRVRCHAYALTPWAACNSDHV